MTTRRFLLVAVMGLSSGALCLTLAALLDNPALAVIGTTFVLGVVVARATWTWRGAGRQWLLSIAGLTGVVLLAFVYQALVE